MWADGLRYVAPVSVLAQAADPTPAYIEAQGGTNDRARHMLQSRLLDTVEDFLMKRLIALFLLTASLAALSACNTMAGAGEDVSAGGHALTDSAEKAK